MVNDYRRNNWSAYLYKVEDYGKKVTRVVDDSDVFGPVLSVLQDPVEPNLLWVGGEYGLYVSTNGGGTFQKWDKNMPTVQVMDRTVNHNNPNTRGCFPAGQGHASRGLRLKILNT